ncbi:hypothetical protein OAG84_03925, partial [Akkermansiaceae bacterium]|nr:hypothetical protein [Akkermansiaceae bacterium]
RPNSFTRQPSHLIDFMATCIEISEVSYPKTIGGRTIDPLQGKSLLPIFAGQERKAHDPLYFHFSKDRALRSGDWKIASAKMGRWELYNLSEDRTELDDLSAKHPKRVKEMVAQWQEIARTKDRLPKNQLKAVKDTLTPQKFGIRSDPRATK